MNLYTFGVFFGDSLYFFRREYLKAQLLHSTRSRGTGRRARSNNAWF